MELNPAEEKVPKPAFKPKTPFKPKPKVNRARMGALKARINGNTTELK